MNQTAYLQRIVPDLLNWYQKNRRKLPWREKPLPYYVWVSEIMLQQTRVEAVKPYFNRLIEALPTVRDLADCPEDRLMKLWEGLGYYSRAFNMQKAARVMTEMYGGNVPDEAEELIRLPGIGSYTAAAVSSIAYGRCEAAVDGNVLRVVSRICRDPSCVDEPKVKKYWEDTLRNVMEEAADAAESGSFCRSNISGEKEQVLTVSAEQWSPGNFNQAMMELGATVCLPNGEPDCGNCPLRGFCLAHLQGCETALPVRRSKKARRLEEKTVLVIVDGEHTVLDRRDRKGLLGGLWELPNFEGFMDAGEATQKAREMGLDPIRAEALPGAKHVFSHIEWHMTGFLVYVKRRETALDRDMVLKTESGKEYLFTTMETAKHKYAVPSAFSAYMKYLGKKDE